MSDNNQNSKQNNEQDDKLDNKEDVKEDTKPEKKELTEEEIEKLKKEREEMEKKAKEVILDFLKDNGDAVIEAAIQYTKQCGLGALFITLTPDSSEADIEYFKVEDLDGGFKKKILDNPNKDTSIFYAIKLSHFSYILERNLGEKVEDYVA